MAALLILDYLNYEAHHASRYLRLSSVEVIDYIGSMATTTARRLADPQIMGLLYRVVDRARENFSEVAAEFDLTPPQARALLYLGEVAPMRALAGHLSCDASNITGIADRLESRSLVKRGEDQQDRRVKLLLLTSEGADVRSRLERRLMETSPFMAGLSAAERATLKELLSKIAGSSRPGA
jgi:DNA-binding MarR family transcriptional regulator